MHITREDANEIYYATEWNEPLAELLGPDGENLSNQTFEPSAAQLAELRDAVADKLSAVRSGFYGQDRLTRKWVAHLVEILETLNGECNNAKN